jgi:bifunctional DNA-binding transcriptional regulator/antitoxin component of YhaV-PrlF toxin-antitoxin module
MARRKLGEKNIRVLSKTGGNTYYVTLPVEAIREFGWQKDQKLEVEVDEKQQRIIIKDWEK